MNKHGQSIIEYTLIAVLVGLGIYFMGPYLLRSVDAHFKLWDEGVSDSFSEQITQAPVSALPPINLTCTCTTTKGSCCLSLPCDCAIGQREFFPSCNNPGCNEGQPDFTCAADPTCCTVYSKIGCGSLPVPQSGDPGGSPPPNGATGLPSGCVTYGTSSCYADQSTWNTACSSLPVVCCADPLDCDQCQGASDPNATICPGAGQPQGTVPFSVVANQAACNGTACQYYCNPNTPPYTVTNGVCTLTPPPTIGCYFYCGAGDNKNPGPSQWNFIYQGCSSGPQNCPSQSDNQIGVSMQCSGGLLQGICINNSPQNVTGSIKKVRGIVNPPQIVTMCSAPSTPGSISCTWTGDWTFWIYNSGGSCNFTYGSASNYYDIFCANGVVTSFTYGAPPATTGPGVSCNWSGTQNLYDGNNGGNCSGNVLMPDCEAGQIANIYMDVTDPPQPSGPTCK